jgi:hypothetical protein
LLHIVLRVGHRAELGDVSDRALEAWTEGTRRD